MQLLRIDSFMSRPTLVSIQTLLLIGSYLNNSGRSLDAWTLFGITIRLAHSMGLHRDPRRLDAAPSIRESKTRQSLWWWMLHLDQQFSVVFGRPLGITGYGDCPPPVPLTTEPTVIRFADCRDRFTILSRDILSSDSLMDTEKIEKFTDELLDLWKSMPAVLKFHEGWLRRDAILPEPPLASKCASE